MEEQELPIGLLDRTDPEYDDGAGESGGRHHHSKVIVVKVFAPREPEPKRFRFRVNELVGNAAKVAAEAFEYEVGTPSFQVKSGTVLDRSLTLEAAGVHNHEELELVDAGGGV